MERRSSATLAWPRGPSSGRPSGRATLAVGLLLVAAGCAVLPIPARDRVVSGPELVSDTVSLIRIGTTTRAEIVQVLGEPSIEFPDIRTIAYSSVVLTSKVLWSFWSAGGALDVKRQDFLLVAFDDSGRVLARELGKRKGGTIRSHALRWIERERLDIPSPPRRFVEPEAPNGRARLFVYRPGGFRDAKLMGNQPAIGIDGRWVAELRKGAFVAVLLPPGPHEIAVDPVHEGDPDLKQGRKLSVTVLPDSTYFVETWVRWGFGSLDPALVSRAVHEAEPRIRSMRLTW